MRLVLDSNEYIYAFGRERNPACEKLLRILAREAGDMKLFVPVLVVDEVRRNIEPPVFKQCHRFWRDMNCVFEDEGEMPAKLLTSYQTRGLKLGDALIGAYTEWIQADILISENRDFLALAKPLPFRVRKAAAFLKGRGII